MGVFLDFETRKVLVKGMLDIQLKKVKTSGKALLCPVTTSLEMVMKRNIVSKENVMVRLGSAILKG